MVYKFAWWQTLLQIAINALFVGGVLGLFGALYYAIRGRPYPPGRHPLRMAVVSLIVISLGGISFILTQGLMMPLQIDQTNDRFGLTSHSENSEVLKPAFSEVSNTPGVRD